MGYLVEYAKSNRSTCRKCKGTIAQDSPRVAKMVPSPHFDGDMPLWHHPSCILSRSITDVNQLPGIETLRWADQQKLKKLCGLDTSAAEPAASKKASAEPEEDAGEDFGDVKYSGGHRKCDKCGESFPARTLRVIVAADSQTYHVSEDCLTLPNNISTSSFTGFAKLKPEDKEILEELIHKANPSLAKKSAALANKSVSKLSEKELVDKLWKIKDEVRKKFNSNELKAILKFNDQSYHSAGPSVLVDRVADGKLFGALPTCPDCKGHLHPESGGKIKCHGHLSAWSRCVFETTNDAIKRTAWKMPTQDQIDDLVEEIKDEKNSEKNAFLAGPSESETVPEDLFKDLTFIFLGATDTDTKQKIEEGGGKVVATFTAKVTHALASYDDMKTPKKSVKFTKATSSDIPILDPVIIQHCAKKKKSLTEFDEIDNFKVWVDGAAVKPDEDKIKLENTKKRKRMVIPLIDKDCDERETHSIYCEGPTVFAITLNMTDLTVGSRGKNSLYLMQCLQHKTKKRYSMFTKWGRIGLDLNFQTTDFSNAREMVQAFEEKFFKFTGNFWKSYVENSFEKKPGKYFPVDLEEEDEDEDEEVAEAIKAKRAKLQTINKAAQKALDPRVQELIQLIFNKEMMNKQMEKMNIDVKKMPLGQLSKRTLKSGIVLLEQIEEELKQEKPSDIKLADLCNQFYTKIPHDFGSQKPPIIRTSEMLQQKYDLLDTLLDIEVAARMLEKEATEDDPIMRKYKELNNDIIALDKSSDEWKRLETYVTNTCEHTKLKILDIYKVNRHGEADTFAKHNHLEYRKLLFHGSNVAVFPAILSGGIKIMPHSGGRVGRGNYSADMIQKSQGYCGLHGRVGLILLNEVALGKIHKITRDDSSLVRAPNGFDSVLACGSIHPDPSKEYIDKTLSPSGHPVVIPQGKKTSSADGSKSSFLHNEYLVYNAEQVHMRYLLRLEWP